MYNIIIRRYIATASLNARKTMMTHYTPTLCIRIEYYASDIIYVGVDYNYSSQAL